jgi:hypothetical protein
VDSLSEIMGNYGSKLLEGRKEGERKEGKGEGRIGRKNTIWDFEFMDLNYSNYILRASS